MAAFLVPIGPGLCVIPLEKAVVLIGRQGDCDVSLTQSRKVSRRHCCLAQVNNQIMARDLGSTNGIYLNGERVKKQCKLKLGDEFMIGDLKFRLQSDPKPPRLAVPNPNATAPVEEEDEEGEENAVATLSSKPTPYVRHHAGGEMPSLEIPVVLPEEGRDFAVEASLPKLPSQKKRRSRRNPADSESDVIPLATDSSV